MTVRVLYAMDVHVNKQQLQLGEHGVACDSARESFLKEVRQKLRPES